MSGVLSLLGFGKAAVELADDAVREAHDHRVEAAGENKVAVKNQAASIDAAKETRTDEDAVHSLSDGALADELRGDATADK